MKKNSLSVEEFDELSKQLCTIVDLRDPEVFATAFIPGSINLKLNDKFRERAGHFFQTDQSIILVTEEGQEEQSIEKLEKLRYTNIKGYLKNGISSWLKKSKSIDLVISMDAEELALEIKFGKLVYYDIREKDVFKVQHIKSSQNMSIDELIKDDELTDNKNTICVYSDDGCLSMALISYLKTHGKHNFYHISGGFDSIKDNTDIEFISSKK